MKKGLDYPGVTLCFFCHDGNGEFVLMKRGVECRDEHGKWDFGGGSLEVHDTIEGTLRKEIKEELCADILEFEFLGYRDVHRENEGVKTHWVSLDFKVRVERAQVKNGEPHKFDDFGWFSLDALPAPLHSQVPSGLVLYRPRLEKR